MKLINWGSETPEQLEQRRRFEEEAMEWARAKMLAEAQARNASSSTAVAVGGGGVSESQESTTTTTTISPGTTTTTTSAEPTTTTTTEEPTTTTTTEDPNWVELVFTSMTWAEANVGDTSSLGSWNSSLISSAGSNFTSLSLNNLTNTVRLYGGSGVSLNASALAGSSLVSIIDNGSVIVEAGNNCFDSCSSLTTTTLFALQTAGTSVFSGCSALTSVSFPALSTAGDSCFENCSSVTTFDLPVLTTLGDYFFKNCTSATSFTLSSVSSLGTGANASSAVDDGVFEGIIGQTVSISANVVPTTATGAYDDDLIYLFTNNTVTLNSQDPMWVEMDSASWAIDPKPELSATGNSYGDGSPTASILGFVASQTAWPTTADTVINSIETAPGVSFTASSDAAFASGTWYVRAYVTYVVGTFYSLNQLEVTVIPFSFNFLRRTDTDVSDPPTYINGEPFAATSAGDGQVYFDLSFAGDTGSITDTGIVSSINEYPTETDNPQSLAPGQGIEYNMPAGQRYFRAYALLDGVGYFYTDSPGILFTMEEMSIDPIIVTPLTGAPDYNNQVDFAAQLASPIGTVSSVGFSWKILEFASVDEPDPYYSATGSITLSPPTSPFSFNHSIVVSSQFADKTCNVRAWAVIDGVKYWSEMQTTNV